MNIFGQNAIGNKEFPKGRWRFFAFILIVVVMLSVPVASNDDQSSAEPQRIYGSTTDPYGGAVILPEELIDGSTYYVVKNAYIEIGPGLIESDFSKTDIESVGLKYYNHYGVIVGTLSETTSLSICGKTINLQITPVYGDFPIFGSVVATYNINLIGQVGTSFDKWQGYGSMYYSGTQGPNLEWVKGQNEMNGVGIVVTVEKHKGDGNDNVNYGAIHLVGTFSNMSKFDYEVIVSPSGSTRDYVFKGTVESYHVITLDSGYGSCEKSTLKYSSTKDSLELPAATPAQNGYHFDGWYTDPSGGERVGGAGDNPFNAYSPNGDFTLYAHYSEDVNPVTKITISGSSSIKIGESTILNAETTLLDPSSSGNRHVVWDLISGSSIVDWGSAIDLDTGGRITVVGTKVGTATFRAMAADNSTDSSGNVICDYFTISVTESALEQNSFTLVYYPTLSGVSSMPSTFSTTSTQSYYQTQVAVLKPTHPEYTFLGWSRSEGAKTPDLLSGSSISLSPGTNNLYAVWQKIDKVWTLTFDANGGHGGPSQIQEHDSSTSHTFRLPSNQYNPQPPDASKEFGGWSKIQNSQIVAAYPGGSLYTETENTTLYAIWNDVAQTNTFTLHFDANRGTGAPPDKSITDSNETCSIKLPDNEPSRPGYHFEGWCINPYWNSGDDLYGPNATFLAYPGTTTLYAIWTQTSFTITFNPNNGSGGPGVIESSGTGSAQITIPTDNDPVRYGYTFKGWSEDPNGDADLQYAKGRIVLIDDNITLYAVWVKNTESSDPEIDYEFHFIVEEEVTNCPGDEIVKGSKDGVFYKIPETIPKTTGLIFKGWADSENSPAVVWYSGESYSFDKLVNNFYPVWEKPITTWSLSFHPNGGIGAPPTQYATPEGNEHIFVIPTEPKPSRVGYTFLGWDQNPDVNNPSIPNTSSTFRATEKDTILYAIWAEGNNNVFTLNFDANGGSDAPAPISDHDVGSHAFTIPLQFPNKDGKIFVGWSESSSGGVVAFVGATYVSSSKDVTLYAIWATNDGQSKNFTIYYQPYKNANIVQKLIASNGNSAIHTLMTEDDPEFPTRPGYKFIGWSETEGGKIIDKDTYSTESMNVVLYGVWSSTSTTFPEASIDYSKDGLTVKMDGSLSPNALTWFWDMGDGTKYGTSSFEHTYSEAGTYLISLTVSNGSQQDVKKIYITVEDDKESSIMTYVIITIIAVIMIVVILRFIGVV